MTHFIKIEVWVVDWYESISCPSGVEKWEAPRGLGAMNWEGERIFICRLHARILFKDVERDVHKHWMSCQHCPSVNANSPLGRSHVMRASLALYLLDSPDLSEWAFSVGASYFTFWYARKFPVLRGFCEYMKIFELMESFICKAILDTHEVFSVSPGQYFYDCTIS